MSFVDRGEELQALGEAFNEPRGSLFVLYGRRRVGKTTLLKRFARQKPSAYHVADRSVEADARRFLAASMAESLGEPTLSTSAYPDWYSLFAAFDRVRPRRGKTLLILDEYQYLAEIQPAFSSYVQKWWDESWRDSNLMLVLCGSLVSMMYREALSRSSPLYGRRSGQWLLKPLRFRDAAELLDPPSPDEAVALWSLAGGVPFYCELAGPKRRFAHALRELVLSRSGPLYAEARYLLQDEVTTPNVYWSLLHAIGSGVSRISELAGRLGKPANQLTRYLTTLQDLGMVRREVPVTETKPERSKKGIYQMIDPFLRLWFGCVAPFESLLELGRISQVETLIQERVKHHQAWAFEQIARQHVEQLAVELGAVRAGRYWDRRSEIDVVAVDEHAQPVLACECKWARAKMGVADWRKLKAQVDRLWPERANKIRLALFSRSGFKKELSRQAEKDGTLLASPAQLMEGEFQL